jgi:hypothetical protein
MSFNNFSYQSFLSDSSEYRISYKEGMKGL